MKSLEEFLEEVFKLIKKDPKKYGCLLRELTISDKQKTSGYKRVFDDTRRLKLRGFNIK